MGQEKNEGQAGTGDRTGAGENKKTESSGKDGKGNGSFIELQKKERDKVQQATESAFPAEFRELIKQYNLNIKNGAKAISPKAGDK